MKKKSRSGFSLIELMVVISIIGVLMATGAVSYTTAQRKARDASRRSDMKAMQNALEQYYVDNTFYKATSGTDTCADLFDDPVERAQYSPSGRAIDPRNTGSSVYTFACTPASFCICALLENEVGNSDSAACAFDSSGDEDYFCVVNQQ